MNVWRFGSKYGSIDALQIFLRHKVVFAGEVEEGRLRQVKIGDLVVITKGTKIRAVGKVQSIHYLSEILPEIIGGIEDGLGFILDPFFFDLNFPEIDFGYHGQGAPGRRFNQINEQRNEIIQYYQSCKKQYMSQYYTDLLIANRNLILTGPPGTGKTYLARQIADDMIFTGKFREGVLGAALETYRHVVCNQNDIDLIDEAWAYWRARILSQDFNLDDYVDVLPGMEDAQLLNNGGYLMNFLERTTRKVYGSSKPGNAFNYGIKKNIDGTYTTYLQKEISISYEAAQEQFDQHIKPWLQQLLQAGFDVQIDQAEHGHHLIRAGQFFAKILVLEHPDQLLSVYQGNTIRKAYNYFVGGAEGGYYRQNLALVQHLCDRFGFAQNKENLLRLTGFIWDYFNKEAIHEPGDTDTGFRDQHREMYTGFVQFHPSYDYTDFFDGLRPELPSGSQEIVFRLKNGIFKEFCRNAKKAWEEDAAADPADRRKFVFLIDEINRAEIAKVFGELFFSIDPGYRGVRGAVTPQYARLQNEETYYTNVSDDRFYVPENVYIVGTMNDIDRSVESFDFAMRRRFCWLEIGALDRIDMWNNEIKDWKAAALVKMKALNGGISDVPGLGSAYHIGPAYFLRLKETDGDFGKLWQFYLVPLLKEYLRGMPNAEMVLANLSHAYQQAQPLS